MKHTTKYKYLASKKGFTVVELVSVIVIIAILATVTVVAYNGVQKNAYDRSVQSDIDNLAAAQTSYALKNQTGGKAWYSKNGNDSALNFSPSSGNVIDVTVNGKDFCIRGYNPRGNKNTIDNSFTKGSTNSACSTLSPSDTARGVKWVWDSVAMPDDSTGSTKYLTVSSDGQKMSYFGGSKLVQSTNAGQTWVTQSNTLNIGASSKTGNRLVATTYDNNKVYISNDFGATWLDQNLSPGGQYDNWTGATISANGNYIAVVSRVKLMVSTNGGASWVQRTLPPESRNWAALSFSGSGERLILTSYGMTTDSGDKPIYISSDAGASWTKVQVTGTSGSSNYADDWSSVRQSDDGSRIALTNRTSYTDGLLSLSQNSGQNWSRNRVTSIADMSSDGSTLAIYSGIYDPSNQSTISVSRDFGASWQDFGGLSGSVQTIKVSSDGQKIYAVTTGPSQYAVTFYVGSYKPI